MNDTEKLQIAIKALTTIRDDGGAVCPDFMTCDHKWCSDSAGAKLIALETLQILHKDCIECVKSPVLSVTVIVDNIIMNVLSCQNHPLERAKDEIRRNDLEALADTKGYKTKYAPLL